MTKNYQHVAFLLILLAYLSIGALYALYTPSWQAPDEPAHYNYVRQLAAGNLPVIEPGDYDQAYIEEVVFHSHFAPGYSIEPFTYEDWQPPLYYLLQTPIFWLTGGALPALRLVSVLLGAGVMALAYGVGRRLWPEKSWPTLTTAAFVAFLPQHLAILASVNNDSLAQLLIAAILFVLMDYVRRDSADKTTHRSSLILGLLLGLGFLTKGTVYPLALIVALTLLWRFWGNWRALWRQGWWVFGPALLLGALWWGRNVIVYDGFDILGKAAHDAVVVGQPRTSDWIAERGAADFARRFVQTTFNSFWGQFGWMTVPMPPWVYRPLALFTGIVLLGLAAVVVSPQSSVLSPQSSVHATQSAIRNPQSAIRNPQSAILLTTFLLTVAVYLGYNLTFVQHQGRYLFPALIPIGVGVTVGLAAWLRPFARRWPLLYNLLPIGLALALGGLALLALYRFILPNL